MQPRAMEVRQTARQPHLLQSESEVAAAAAASRGSRWFQMIPRNYVLHLHSLGRDGWVWLWVKNGRFFLIFFGTLVTEEAAALLIVRGHN
jgi:hypothetical protein